MAGALTPSSGSALLEDRKAAAIPSRELARRLAVVPQENPVAFDYTVLEVAMMGRSPHLKRFELERNRDLDAVTKALERTNLLHFADHRIGALSGGERRRAVIARALAQETEILFLDEPTAHLDINYQVEILHLLKRENVEHGKTVVVVLHDLNLAAEFCDRLVMLRDGEVFALGRPEEVITVENVQRAYGSAVLVRRHPTSGKPYVLSLGSRATARPSGAAAEACGLRVHVICGGGSGGPVFTRLIESGCEVTAGVINIGDTDQEAAESFGIEYVEDAPFSAISEAAERANLAFVDQSEAVIVADMPLGVGNLANLRHAAHALDLKKPVAIIGGPETFSERDFADGEASRILMELIERGAVALETANQVPAWVAEIKGRVV
jgi:iron complex transport system ATP-binding protein